MMHHSTLPPASQVNAAPSPSNLPRGLGIASAKIRPRQLELGGALYIRQSSPTQLRDHQESTARQYGLKDHLLLYGWKNDQIVVIDDDLAISGSGKADRPGFRRLLQLVTEGRVGIVIGLEMSRLARNSRDWADLFEVCAIFGALLADEDGVFDPQDPNDRMILGLKGIIAEMELHMMKMRLERGRLNKAQRGEMFHSVPVGYILDERGLPQPDPDESARHVMKQFFALFEEVGSASGLFRELVARDIKLPFRHDPRCRRTSIDWRLPSSTTVYGLLKHPLYAGAYGYRIRESYRGRRGEKRGKKHLPPEQWKVLIKDLHPSYITWEQYEQNQQRLRDNDSRGDRCGPVREGSALLAGIVRCAHCGRRLSLSYPPRGHALYYCTRQRTVAHAEPCHSTVRCATLDQCVEQLVLQTLSAAGVDLNLRVIEDEETRRAELDRLYAHRVEQARYEAELSERRYKLVDPSKRLVAEQLESEWEAALEALAQTELELNNMRLRQPSVLTDEQRREMHVACSDITSLWRGHATIKQRKQIVRLLLQRVDVDVQKNTERVHVRVLWTGGYESHHELRRSVMQFQQLENFQQLRARVLELALAGTRSPKIAAILESEGYWSPRVERPISPMMVQKLMTEDALCRQALNDPRLETDHWRLADLARELGIPDKKLKSWVLKGWARAIQRPHGRTWVIYADGPELERLKMLACYQKGQGSRRAPENLRTPAGVGPKKP